MNYWTACAETEHCFYQELRGRNKTNKYCRILNTADDRAPYKDGMCPFYKKHETDIGRKIK